MSGPAHNAARHALAAALLFLPGCAAVHVAGDVAEAGVRTTGAVVGGAIDVVTTSDSEKADKAKKAGHKHE